MATMLPIEKGSIKTVVKILENGYAGPRDSAMFMVGICTGARISEVLSLKTMDLVNSDNSIKKHLTIRMTKTSRTREVLVAPAVTPFIEKLIKYNHNKGLITGDSYLFASGCKNKPISRFEAYYVLKRAFKYAGLKDRYGTHSMRKTYAKFCYNYYKDRQNAGDNVDPLVKTMEALGHASIESTRKYLAFMFTNNDEFIKNMYGDDFF